MVSLFYLRTTPCVCTDSMAPPRGSMPTAATVKRHKTACAYKKPFARHTILPLINDLGASPAPWLFDLQMTCCHLTCFNADATLYGKCGDWGVKSLDPVEPGVRMTMNDFN